MSLSKQHHEGFACFFEKPTRENLRELIKGNIGETDYLDFKSTWPKFPKLAKHILGMANSGGGALVIGIEQNENGVAHSIGLNEIEDKAIINKGLKNILPTNVSYDIIDFSYKDSEYQEIKGKNFQVLLVEYEPKHIPFLTKKAADGIKDNTVYVRRGTNTDEATHDELQKLINKRIETGYSTRHVLELNDHLDQLETLYSSVRWLNKYSSADMEEHRDYVTNLILRKKSKIEEELELK